MFIKDYMKVYLNHMIHTCYLQSYLGEMLPKVIIRAYLGVYRDYQNPSPKS
jgi:hypothetical protein